MRALKASALAWYCLNWQANESHAAKIPLIPQFNKVMLD
jgi:hypothetical protein